MGGPSEEEEEVEVAVVGPHRERENGVGRLVEHGRRW